jgi:hypothetical protein
MVEGQAWMLESMRDGTEELDVREVPDDARHPHLHLCENAE